MPSIDRLLVVMERLRDPDGGCPWDLEQTFETIAPYTVEEAYEVDHAIRCGDMDELCGELGDLLFQVVYHAQMASEAGHFDFETVARGIVDKLIRRHPHVFGDAEIASAEAQTTAWENMKADERAGRAEASGRTPSAFDDLPRPLPALTRAVKLTSRASRIEGSAGLETDPAGTIRTALDHLERGADLESGAARAEIGSLLRAAARLARSRGVDPEAALRDSNHDFERRARGLETSTRPY